MSAGSPSQAELLRAGETVVSVTVGDSMEPLLHDRSTQVEIAPLTGPLRRGDLPLYRRPGGQMVLHRVIRTGADSCRTRGDNRCGLETVPLDWVCGVVTAIHRNGRDIRVTDRGYRLYVRLWLSIYPLRWVLMRARRVFREVCSHGK